MEIIIIPGIFAAVLGLIGTSFFAGVRACDRYYKDIHEARVDAVEEYRAKEQALFNLAQDEVEYYKRALIARSPEIPLQSDAAHWSQAENSVAFTGKKSQFK